VSIGKTLKFRFNTAGDKACEWYSKLARRRPRQLGYEIIRSSS